MSPGPLLDLLTVLQVRVELTTTLLAVSVDEMPLLTGKLYQEIKRDESTWYIQARKGVGSKPPAAYAFLVRRSFSACGLCRL